MVDPRSYTRTTVMALAHHSGGLCYSPGCPEPVLAEIADAMRFVAQIAHIRAATPDGPRYDPSMTNDERRDFPNLILLCKPHHDDVDNAANARTYTVDMLLRWKAQRESSPAQALRRLREVTPPVLARTVRTAVERHDARILELLNRLDGTDAAALRMLLDELTEAYSQVRRGLDPETVDELSHAIAMLNRMEFRGLVDEFSLAVGMLHQMGSTMRAFIDSQDR